MCHMYKCSPSAEELVAGSWRLTDVLCTAGEALVCVGSAKTLVQHLPRGSLSSALPTFKHADVAPG